ncbi:MAG TPA: RAMP superfamily CRISPR-associated protein [Ktedonobacteraceae bacterium]|jgi:CRISPR/Cas system CSM-associated protein Csm3 (group 7 of RAMP superfamily)|nr:RAMP superfamily CRISPR-associated protein [Ktedonobacteraceae bacterium]
MVATRTDRIRIDYTLTFLTPFHFGTGIREGLVDRTVVKDGAGYLYVPGSTFKGVVRERCEQLARLFEELDRDMHDRIIDPHEEKLALLTGFSNITTMITRIFGSHIQPGHLFFDDARQDQKAIDEYDGVGEHEKGRYKNLQLDRYTQVRINRLTCTAVPGALYTSEFGLKGLQFHGSISGWLQCTPIDGQPENPTYSLLLLLTGLHMVDRLGGNKSTGKGQCRCEITRVAMGTKEYIHGEWKAWFDRLDALSLYSSDADTARTQEEEK